MSRGGGRPQRPRGLGDGAGMGAALRDSVEVRPDGLSLHRLIPQGSVTTLTVRRPTRGVAAAHQRRARQRCAPGRVGEAAPTEGCLGCSPTYRWCGFLVSGGGLAPAHWPGLAGYQKIPLPAEGETHSWGDCCAGGSNVVVLELATWAGFERVIRIFGFPCSRGRGILTSRIAYGLGSARENITNLLVGLGKGFVNWRDCPLSG